SLASRRDHREAINRILEVAFREKSTEEWLALLGRESVPCGPVNTVDRVVGDPQVLARKMVVEVEHPTQGRFPVLGNPIKCSAMEEAQIQAPPMLGQHTEEVLRRLLEYSEETIRDLRRAGIV
ncbi:MAG: CoA transferase, partial [Candidatus Tectomicrobia bacterium]|nr:CoA transferase [Candidatus Tectomicrobia bacterium]